MELIIHVRDMIRNHKNIDLVGQMDLSRLVDGKSGIIAADPLSVKLQAQEQRRIVIVTGDCHTELELACVRCLSTFPYALSFDFHERFQEQANGDSPPSSDEDESMHVLDTEQVDLHPYLEQAIWLALPFAPVCGEDCQGLCPVCGLNQNEQHCQCKKEEIDPRLAVLKDWQQ